MRRRASDFLSIGHLACSLNFLSIGHLACSLNFLSIGRLASSFNLCTVVVLLSGLMGCKPVVAQRALVLSTGVAHSCAIQEDRSLICWGEDEAGFLESSNCGGDSVFGANGLACGQSSPPEGRFLELSSSGLSSCAIDEGGELQCWGIMYSEGQAPPEGRFHGLVGAMSSSDCGYCALDEENRAVCWTPGNLLGRSADTGFRSLAVNCDGFCGVRGDGSVQCAALHLDRSVPVPPDDEHFRSIAAAGKLFCGITEDARLRCWGSNAQFLPADATQRWERFSGAGVCARRSDGVFVCFRDGLEPLELSGFEELSMGEAHYCGLRADGKVECATHSKHVRCPDCTEVPEALR